jgi:Uma2 family endonuclease
MVQVQRRYYTTEEYLQQEEQADTRSEYRDGDIIPMAGGTTNHNEIVTNLCAGLKLPLRQKGYRLFTENVRVWIDRYRVYTYPDVMVIAGEPNYHGTGTTTVINPCLIVEVMSKSTKNYDQGDKFDYYRSLPDLQEYVLVEQSRVHVLQYSKTTAGKWLLTELETETDLLEFTSVSIALSLADLYTGVDFSLNEDEPTG